MRQGSWTFTSHESQSLTLVGISLSSNQGGDTCQSRVVVSGYSPQTSRIRITWELVRNVDFLGLGPDVLNQKLCVVGQAVCCLTSSSGDSDTHESWEPLAYGSFPEETTVRPYLLNSPYCWSNALWRESECTPSSTRYICEMLPLYYSMSSLLYYIFSAPVSLIVYKLPCICILDMPHCGEHNNTCQSFCLSVLPSPSSHPHSWVGSSSLEHNFKYKPINLGSSLPTSWALKLQATTRLP